MFVFIFAPLPVSNKIPPLFVESPLFLRIISGPFRTLMADWLWLRSAHLSPSASIENEPTKSQSSLYDATQLIMTLDPQFDIALRYATTYLSSILKKVDQAHQLCDIAIQYHPQAALPYILKISNELGYHHPYRHHLIIQWIKQAKNNTSDSPTWLNDVLIYARKQLNQGDIIKHDLEWLLSVSRNKKERDLIQKKLDQLGYSQ